MSDGTDVLRAIDQLRRDLSGYHGQLVAHNELQRHCERQKEQLAALQAAHKPIKDERDLYKRQTDRLAAENAKLRDELAKWERLADGIDLPEYPVAQFVPKDLERENAKLRELVDELHPLADYGAMDASELDRAHDLMRELGIEVC